MQRIWGCFQIGNNIDVDPQLFFSSRTCHPDHTLMKTLKEVFDERSELTDVNVAIERVK
jgi:hypothetical protein